MWQDPIVEEIRRIRDEHARRFDYDLHAICEDFRKEQMASGHAVVSRKPRRPAAPAEHHGALAETRATAALQQGRG